MISTEKNLGRFVLLVGNVAGMVDLVALPLWISGLMQSVKLDPQQAGLQVTLYIFGVFLASVIIAPRFDRIPARFTAASGFAIAAASFFFLQSGPTGAAMGIAHLAAGIGAGLGLSSVHGTIGRSVNPLRLFAIASFGVGAFAIPFFVVIPGLMATGGLGALMMVFGILMLAASALSALAFPTPPVLPEREALIERMARVPFSQSMVPGLALAFVGVVLMATAQAMAFSFVDRLGAWRGFAPELVAGVFIVGGFISFTAPIVAGFLERKIRASHAAIAALIAHGVLTYTTMNASTFPLFAAAAASFVFFIIFGHTFMFGLISRLDPTGRASSSTPAMLMIGSAIGPVMGGTIVKAMGYPALGLVTALLAFAGAACFLIIALTRFGAVANGRESADRQPGWGPAAVGPTAGFNG